MAKYQQTFPGTKKTPQSQPIPGKAMVANSAGGFAFPVDKWGRLNRFLILGADTPTYYIEEKQLVKENAESVIACVKEDGVKTVNRIVEISDAGRAPKNDPALFALVLAIAFGDDKTKAAAYAAFSKVVRIGTHLFQIADMHKEFGGWGRGWRGACADWYTSKKADQLCYQLVKYQQRGGWAHGDILRLAHPKAQGATNLALAWAADKLLFEDGQWFTKVRTGTPDAKDVRWEKGGAVQLPAELRLLEGFERVKAATTEGQVKELIRDFHLPWEAIPTQHLASPDVWAALLPDMPMTATMRNLGRMTANGLLQPNSQAARTVTERFANAEAVKKSRVHPLNVLVALRTYQMGHGLKGSLAWGPVREVVDALDALFYTSFGNVEPSGKNIVLALDISGSMDTSISSTEALSCREASAAMAMVTARCEPHYSIVGFSDRLIELNISPRQRLDDVVKSISDLPFGGTDCSWPMRWAMGEAMRDPDSYSYGYMGRNRKITAATRPSLPVDGFVVYTDSETWAGQEHPVQALQRYRKTANVPAKLVVVGMASNGFSIADPDDGGMLDVVGFDTSAPQVISDFIRGGL